MLKENITLNKTRNCNVYTKSFVKIGQFFIFTINIVNLIYLQILWILKIWRLLQKRRKQLSESFFLTQWNAIINDNTSSQQVLFFFYFFFRYHFTMKNKTFWENSKFIELTSLVKWPTWLFNGKVTNILLSVLTLFLSSCHAFFNFSTVFRLLHLLFFLL